MAGREVTEKNTCSVCLEVFREPKVLPCCHTFCLTCLEKTARGSSLEKGEITCPQCRKTHEIPTGGLAELLSDFIATYEVEVAGLKSSTSHKGGEKTLVCGECERPGPVQSYCIDCQNYLCNECGFQLHKMLKAYRGHKVIPIKDINATTLQRCQIHYCKVHRAESLRLYCGTCSKLICRDCTLVEHRQHDYTFVEDARKQVDAEMNSLQSDVKQKLATFRRNLQEIRKVEESATGHAQVLKTDINKKFSKLIRSIEARRKVVLEQAGTDCHKDLKQIWADKEFHEVTISHISSVLDLVEKARKCTSDSEMILTALQSIHQLKLLHETEWDSDAFTSMVSATPKFIEGENVIVDAVGGVDRVVIPSSKIRLMSHSSRARLDSSISFQVGVTSSHTPILTDGRSGVPVNLQLSISTDFKAVVHYGKSLKQLDDTYVYVSKAAQARKRVIPPDDTYMYKVRVQPVVCGGKHSITFRLGYSMLKHTFTVTGEPQHGARVKIGPDWKPKGQVMPTAKNMIGTVYYQNQLSPYESASSEEEYPEELMSSLGGCIDVPGGEKDMVTVKESSWTTCQYKWGRDGEYEIELCKKISAPAAVKKSSTGVKKPSPVYTS